MEAHKLQIKCQM